MQTEQESSTPAQIPTPTFATQAPIFLDQLQTRRRHPVKPATLAAYRSAIDNWILPAIGSEDLETFGNGAMKVFIQGLTGKNLAAATVQHVVTITKLILASATTPEGDPFYPRTWNSSFLDLPDIGSQKSPALTKEQLTAALQSPRGLFFAFLAGTGLRVGEALAVRCGDDGVHTAWDPENAVVKVRTALWQRHESTPKTASGIREIDLDPRLNALLRQLILAPVTPGSPLFHNKVGRFLWESSLRKFSLKPLGIPGFHVFRRYRITRLRELGVPEDIIRFWSGHAGQGITDRYSKLAENKELRKQWAVRAGLGFSLEGLACDPQPKPKPKQPNPIAPKKPKPDPRHASMAVTKTLVKRRKKKSLAQLIRQNEKDVPASNYVALPDDLPSEILAPATPTPVTQEDIERTKAELESLR